MKTDIYICALIESKMNEIIETINKTYSILEADKLYSELWILSGYYIKFALTKNRIFHRLRGAYFMIRITD